MAIENTAHPYDEGAVLLEKVGPIAIITLSRPAALNALTWTMYQQMETHLEGLAADDAIRAVIIRGEGTAFAAGTPILQILCFSGYGCVAYGHENEALVQRRFNL